MIEFRESDHSYWYDGVRVPGVSEIIDGVGLMDPAAKQHYTKFYADRGTAVHKATELYDKGTLDESSLDPEIVGYVEAYKKFVAEHDPTWVEIEKRGFNKQLFYAGTLDRAGFLNEAGAVVLDIKTGQKAKWHVIQLALYAMLLVQNQNPNLKLYGLYLKGNSIYKLVDYTDPDILKVAESCIRLYHWQRSNR